MRITWVGHATVLLELDGARLLTDPILRKRIAHLRTVHPPPGRDELGPIDAVLLSHAHRDTSTSARSVGSVEACRCWQHKGRSGHSADVGSVGRSIRSRPESPERSARFRWRRRRRCTGGPARRSGSSFGEARRSISPATPTSSPGSRSSQIHSTSPCSRSGGGARPSARAISTRRRPRRPCAC